MANEHYEIELSVKTEGTEQSKQKLSTMEKFIQKIEKRAKTLNKVKISPTARLIDKVTGPAAKIESRLKLLGKKTVSITLKAKDMASSVISKIMSPLSILGAGAGIYGAGNVTLGAAMNFEAQMVSMEHWLKGNKELANQYVAWLDQLAAKTPFEMDDLFPAASRAVGITEGDVPTAERMVKLASDMAGLTPGKSVQDAMEALADAQTGEFERLKEFNVKMTQDEMKKLKNYSGFLSSMEGKFGGGADKLSQTAKGKISTITDTMKTLFRKAGEGMLEALKPRLDKISEWFDKNPEKIKLWKNRFQQFGQQAFESLFSAGSRVINHLDKIFSDPKFEQADFGGKLAILIEDALTSLKDWLDGPGGTKISEVTNKLGAIMAQCMTALIPVMVPVFQAIGTALATALVEGIKGAVKGALSDPSWITTVVRYSPLNSMTVPGQVYNMAEGANATIDYLKNGNNESSPKTTGNATVPFVTGSSKYFEHASGGLFRKPHFGLVAEAGPEVIIPLSSRMRTRAFDLWQQAGQHLGVRPYASGGFAGPVPAMDGGSGLVVNSTNYVNWGPDEDALALKIGRKIVQDIKQAVQNRP